MLSLSLKLTLVVFTLFLLIPTKTHAYLDPGSGSYLIQILVASIAGAGILIKTQWDNIKRIFGKKDSDEKEDDKG
jgi:hypothetical protein